MENVAQKLLELYIDLTESSLIHIQFKGTKITVLIISDWFALQSLEERHDYLVEGLQVVCPEMLEVYQFNFVAYTQAEADGRTRVPMAS